uniref:E3 ubiquitin-protein ligase listerin n=1 Tax=Phallusia mammillata TaxID=59560 RepID=A0A6F9DKQ8_9ASCI|nr:E3 ubiquitin-protein ligase listerin-like [Phallusia mammillata]
MHSALNKELTFGTEMASSPLLSGNQALCLLQSIKEQFLLTDCSNDSVLAFNHLVMDAVKNYEEDADFLVGVEDCLIFALKSLLQRSLENSEHTDTANVAEVVDRFLQTTVAHKKYLLAISNEIQDFLLCHLETGNIIDLVSNLMLSFSERNVSASCIQDWLSALIPNERVFEDWHSSIGSNCWMTLDSILDGNCLTFDVDKANAEPNIPSECDYGLLTILNAIIVGIKAFPLAGQITLSSNFQKLFMESVFLNTIGSCNHELLDVHRNLMQNTDFASVMCKTVFENSVTTGGGWYRCLTYFLEISDSNTTDLFCEMLVSKLTQGCMLTPELATTINLLSEKISKHLSITEWLGEVALENDLTYLQDVEKNCSMALAISCLVKILSGQESTDQSKEVVFSILQLIVQWKASYPDSFLFDCNLSEHTNKQLFYNTAIARFIMYTVSFNVSAIHNDMWDFYQCSTVSWLESVSSTCETSPSTHTLILLNAASKLMNALSTFLTSQTAIEDPTLPSSLTNEWKEFFEPAAHVNLCTIFMLLNSSEICIHDNIIHSMFASLSRVSIDSLLSATSRLKPYLYPGSSLPDSFQTLLYHLCTVFRKPVKYSGATQALSFRLLNTVIQHMFVSEDDDKIAEFKLPDSFHDVLKETSNKTLNMLAVFKNQQTRRHTVTQMHEEDSEAEEDELQDQEATTAETCFPDLDITEFLSLSAYLFTWRLAVKSTNHVKADHRSNYITSMNKDPVTNLDSLLTKLWYLLPDVPLVYSDSSTDMTEKRINLFETEPDFTTTAFDLNLIQHLACLLYKDILSSMPVLIRSWYNDLSKLNRANVDSYTSRYVSPVICKAELQTVSLSKHQQDIAVRARLATREVVARYEVSDADFEITVQLAANHPLSPVQVNTVKRVGVAASQWRYWILQMTMLLLHQNGSIIDALLLWKQKVDKRLDGLEECMICFSVVHGSNAQSLPKLECKTCHKKYHAECLYKWFDTSNQSTCPLCRAPMMFR